MRWLLALTLALSASALKLTQGSDEFLVTDGPAVGTLKLFVRKDIPNLPVTNWQLQMQEGKAELGKLWLLVSYVLK